MFSKLFSGIAESVNPVFIKEMRQYFQNRRMIIFMGVLLLVQFICTLFFSSAMQFDAYDSSGVGFFLLIILAGSVLSVIICAAGAQQRFAEERSDKELNYSMLTTLRPSSIIWGKLEGAMVMILCIFSLLLPFLTAAYFMRGLSAASLLFTLCIFPVLMIYTLAGIFAGAFGNKWITGIFFFALACSTVFLLVASIEIIDDLMSRGGLDSDFWIAVLVEYEIAFLLGVLLFLLSLAVISPPKSNRFCPVKVYLFAMPAIAFLLILPYYIAFRNTGFTRDVYFVIEFIFCACAAVAMTLIAVCEPPMDSLRVYMKCPRGSLGRFVHFLFSSGFAGTLLLVLPVLAAPIATLPFSKLSNSERSTICGIMAIPVSFLSYALLSLLLSRIVKLRIPALAWMIILEIAGNLLGWIPLTLWEGLDFGSRFGGSIPMPLRVSCMEVSHLYCFVEAFESSRTSWHCYYALAASVAVAGVLLLAMSPFLFKTFRQHRRPDIEVKPPTKDMLGK